MTRSQRYGGNVGILQPVNDPWQMPPVETFEMKHGPSVLEATHCPLCKGEIMQCFGLMFGYGPYIICLTDDCNFAASKPMGPDEC